MRNERANLSEALAVVREHRNSLPILARRTGVRVLTLRKILNGETKLPQQRVIDAIIGVRDEMPDEIEAVINEARGRVCGLLSWLNEVEARYEKRKKSRRAA